MTVEQLRAFHRAQPFVPFRMHTADGRSLDVLHPELLAFNPQGRTVVVTKLDDSWEVVDLLLVTTLEAINGKSRRGRK